MQDIIAIADIKTRADAIGLTLPALSKLAKLAPSTAWRVTTGKSDPRFSTLRKLSTALADKEAERLKDLQGRAGQAVVS